MTLTQYYTATTLDGFIADRDNSLEWLFTRRREEGGPLDYDAFIKEVGSLAMGATTYEWILDHEYAGKDPADWVWPYEIPAWVFTHRQLPVVPNARIEFVRGRRRACPSLARRAAAGRNVWVVGGGDLAGQFADAGLLDEVLVTIAPVTLGAGVPLLPGSSSYSSRSSAGTATSRALGSPSCAGSVDTRWRTTRSWPTASVSS